LQGLHSDYPAYFHLNLERHLSFLADKGFLTSGCVREILAEVQEHEKLLYLEEGCLVHKDLALWNILGTTTEILAVIDWDDAISGDPLDDISLLACFYGGSVIRGALDGYSAVRPLPTEYRRRFWLHLLRNMLVKAVIRVGAGYFDRKADFFLIGPGANGQDLRSFTLQRIQEAVNGLRNDIDPGHL
jgi:fructosamine-3-kinase